MIFEYLDTKEGVKTVKANGLLLHSAYSPIKEAERFSLNIKSTFKPSYVIITEPGLSYCAPYLKKSFPYAKIGAIRYTHEFESYNNLFDFAFNKESISDLKNHLLREFSEDNIFSVLFISWTASEKIFPDENKQVWLQIKQALDTAKTLLVTRQFFEKKWLINSANFIKYAQDFYTFNKTSSPVFIAASGPSLQDNLESLKKGQKSFVIIALSSAITTLLENDIIPDFCISTDGGYWAGEHLKKLTKNKIPLAITSEAYCKKEILQNLKIIPLFYNDGISRQLADQTSIPFIEAKRNGTVSGTALDLAKNLTTGKIYYSGLDLSEQKGFQHTQPNELEKNACLNDYFINSKEKRIAKSGFKNQSLMIYKDWFCNQKLENNKFFRIISEEGKKNSLGDIIDISPEKFAEECKLYTSSKTFSISKSKKLSALENKTNIKNVLTYILRNCNTEGWKKSLFPLDFVAIKHNPENNEAQEKLEKENSRLMKKLQKILNDD
ncbi:6-hydroxymethylpterin diphosphokinase MptE-like protein [Treponema sp. C6A8]|uniref:6-hydroxymethylpterin diphosphokinase MptE-like protein n=1 Tax=Treponema sp. C6A8 TaxID=1410609 RepID=UPI0004843FFD|nr:6-hydroxymethylpterin diphosphokinase MptE-like protein [Treponema sp. C6A8]